MQISNHLISADDRAVLQVFEDYYVHEVFDHSSIESVYYFGFQAGHRVEMYICSRI